MAETNESRGTVSIHIRIDPGAAVKLDAIAKGTAGSRSEVIETLLKRAEVQKVTKVVEYTVLKDSGKD